MKITISDIRGEVVREMDGTKLAGLNRVQWNLSPNPPPQAADRGGRGGGRGGRGGQGAPFMNNQAVEAGTYIVKLTVGGKDYMTTVVIGEDALRQD